jgi:hypothetical protein
VQQRRVQVGHHLYWRCHELWCCENQRLDKQQLALARTEKAG